MHCDLCRNGKGRGRGAELQDFDIVLMDISMPEMDGYEATGSIRAREAEQGTPMLPILALTAHVGENYREECIASGTQGMLLKPFRSAKFSMPSRYTGSRPARTRWFQYRKR